jgi:hypothetical protein
MGKDKRRAARRSLHRRALVVGFDNAPLAGCMISNVSGTGAQLRLKAPDQLPDDFGLILARGGKVRRRCQAVWRDDKRIGVRFRGGSERA